MTGADSMSAAEGCGGGEEGVIAKGTVEDGEEVAGEH